MCGSEVGRRQTTGLVVIRKNCIGRYKKGPYWCSVCGEFGDVFSAASVEIGGVCCRQWDT